ncbi:cytochrome P450 [Wenjunlia tyrosinilytica]|jgi:cytochrome P450|uniref:Cytochrome P450 n=1 Tax=Wenjunlia tyrosinilytica TaxID=1544741 RepID=A0A918E044_9ACTN|nr:cytochrome P450 [Wenjunlia tyrosinilytica]GGO92069.1 cytochrome P450 [Wenjunlia tyrosinilytica]
MTQTDSPVEAEALPDYPWIGHNRECPLDPPPLIGRLRADKPVAPVRMSQGMDAWLVTRYEDVKAVLADRRFSADRRRPNFPHVGPPRPVPPGNFVHIDPPDHTRLRRLVSRTFTVKTVESLRPRIQEFTEQLVERIADGPAPADLKEGLAHPLPVKVISELIGIPHADASFFTEATKVFMPTDTPIERAREKVMEVREYVDALAKRKKADPADDLMSRLALEREAHGECTHDELVGLSLVLMFGGYETTSNMIGLALLLLLVHPEQLARVREDPELVKPAVEEVMRYITVVHTGLPRLATEDVEIGGQLIRAGEGVIASLASANRDERAFACPEQFDIDRFDGQREAHHLGFGYGIHQCIGQMLARVQLRAAVETLLRRLPELRLAVPFEQVPFRHDMFLYGVHSLPVTW